MAETPTRIYVVEDLEDPKAQDRLVEAISNKSSVVHCAARFRARVATPKEVAVLVAAGVKLEKAGSSGEPASDDDHSS